MHSPTVAAWAAALSCLSLAASTPVVTISNGTIQGFTSGVVDTFLGIPFAQPPVGSLRFRPPLALNSTFGAFNATITPRACPQLPFNADPQILAQVTAEQLAPYQSFYTPPSSAGEDCLTINVQRPSSIKKTAKLPVLFWIYGGGFETGSTQGYDWANFVTESVSLGHPILVVQANYRISAFGFLAGAELKAEGSTNVGMRDQRLALKWVADNIAAFGGDPDRVTIWGQSAGAEAVLNHLLIEGGNNTYKEKSLFRAAIMNSGSSLPAEPADSLPAQVLFDAVAAAGGCGNTTTADPLSCMRALPYEDLLNATNAVPSLLSYHGLQISFPARPDSGNSFFPLSPEKAIETGRIARIPTITGTQRDEGAFFGVAFYNGTTTDTFVDNHLRYLFPTTPRFILKGLVNTYSTDPALGSPFDTGDANQLYTNEKRNSALIGDAIFTFQRRAQLEKTASLSPTWSFLANYNHTSSPFGTAHGADIALFNNHSPAIPYKHILQYYISFVNYLDPNALSGNAVGNLTHWPRYLPGDKTMIQFNTDGESFLHDDFRRGSYDYFKRYQSQLTL